VQPSGITLRWATSLCWSPPGERTGNVIGLAQALGVYVVTSAGLVPGRTHLDVALAAIEGRAGAVQLRAPELEDLGILPLAADLAVRCRARGVLFVVNDRLEVALEGGADGVHMGQGDDPSGARRRLGRGRVLGVSVGTPAEARLAEEAGADYLGVTVWATPTKPEAVPHGLDGLRSVLASTRLPVVGIGGIDASNARLVLEAGAAGVAVLSAVGAAPDPAGATRTLVETVRAHRTTRGGGPSVGRD
jgi:thiamine-phosphate pyrophosphorylase